MSKHTPGPWSFEKTSINGGYIIGFHDDSGFLAAMSEADARLIAAAPDLMALAYQYRDDLRHPPSPDSRERRLKAIDAAIVKAEGNA